PLVIYAYPYGPDPRHTNAPGDAGTCLASNCHVGALNPIGGGVKITLPGGNTYTPGVKQRIQVQITDAARQKFGFEFTARLASDLSNGQAGDFSTVDALTQTICDNFDIKKNGSLCPAATPVQFIEHTMAGYTASTAGGYTYQFDWMPPATDVGNVTFYVASVAGPSGPPSQNNANVYTSNVTLTPAAAQGNAPAVTPGGVVPVYSSSTTIQPGSWFSVYGTNLAAATTIWNGDFPPNLGGTSVSVNGKDAYLWFVSAGQINAQAPDDTATGSVPFVVKTANGTSTGTVTLGTVGPSFLLLGDGKHATGIIVTTNGSGTQGGGAYDLLGPTSAGAGFRPAKKGEPVAIYAVGLGPTNPVVPSGKIFASAASLVNSPTVNLGGVPVTVDFAGIVGAGLYQINFTVPQNAGSGEQTLQATVNGVTTQANITIPIQ
ncbi:MAG TPA: choice-of-anchor V domain-containing protein, partial [Bryobacteraceae bacterium]|nr:choice-of-anchor V domain-containing protein [Bryobacteraceae bacterium]